MVHSSWAVIDLNQNNNPTTKLIEGGLNLTNLFSQIVQSIIHEIGTDSLYKGIRSVEIE